MRTYGNVVCVNFTRFENVYAYNYTYTHTTHTPLKHTPQSFFLRRLRRLRTHAHARARTHNADADADVDADADTNDIPSFICEMTHSFVTYRHK